jgi:hypothetical protein
MKKLASLIDEVLGYLEAEDVLNLIKNCDSVTEMCSRLERDIER